MNKTSLEKHYEWKGKIETAVRPSLTNRNDLSLAYTPGVAEPCLAIQKEPQLSFDLTRRWNTVAVVTDGTAVLGLGDIGPEASMPVMEGKAALFKQFADIDAIPLCLRSKDTDDIVRTVSLLAGSFGGINLEDISAPRCFEIERRLKEACDIPVFHDDQHGTAAVALAGLINALKITGKNKHTVKIVISGGGAAGTAITKILIQYGFKEIIVCEKEGILNRVDHYKNNNHTELATITNRENKQGNLSDALRGADVFIGVSAPGIVTYDMVKSMATDSIIFAMANPVPEIMPDVAKAAGAGIVASGRSDYPNQINNLLAFPGIFRGALDVRASDINSNMKLAAATALAELISPSRLSGECIIPDPFDKMVCCAVSKSVAESAVKAGIARKPLA